MKILYVTTISNTVNAFLIPHVKFLIGQGHEVDIAFNRVQDVNPELIELGCKTHQVEFNRSPISFGNYVAYKKMTSLVLNERYDLVHTHTPIASFITRIACRNKKNLKILYTAHGFHFFKGAPLLNWFIYYPMEWFASKFTDGIITINKEDYNLVNKFKNKRLKSIFKVNGVGVDFKNFSKTNIQKKNNLRKEYGYHSDDFILFYAAELNFNKNQDMLIHAIGRLKRKIPNIKLLLAGEGKLIEYYKKEVRRAGLNNNVEFLGYRKDIANLLKLSDLAVSASRREGLPVNIMEAMATGLPIIVTDCRGNHDLVTNNKNGFVVGINDIEEFSKKVEVLYNSVEVRNKFSEINTDLAQNYSINNVINDLEYIYSIYSDKKK